MGSDLNLTEDQRQILDAAGAMLASAYPVARLRARQEDDFAEIAAFGAFALALPEAAGGAGFTIVEEALLHVRLGRHLVGPGALAAALAARLAVEAGEEALAARIAGGEIRVCAARASGADLLLVAPPGTGRALVLGDERPILVTIDEIGTTVAEVGLGHGLPMARVGPGWKTQAAIEGSRELARLAALLTSAALLGIAEAARDLAVEYAQVRRQFGKPIGSFQAVKHHAANMALRAEMLSAQLDLAAIALRDGQDDAGFQIACLARLAPRIALENARAAIQIHGGTGFSEEADIHHYAKRAHVLSRLMPPLGLMQETAPLAPFERGGRS